MNKYGEFQCYDPDCNGGGNYKELLPDEFGDPSCPDCLGEVYEVCPFCSDGIDTDIRVCTSCKEQV